LNSSNSIKLPSRSLKEKAEVEAIADMVAL
jgi:hypothetical protein